MTFSRLHLALCFLAAATLLGCATRATRLDAQWVDPQFAGRKAVRGLLVMGVARDEATRRMFEDRMVAAMTAIGVRAVPSYTVIPEEGAVSEDRLRRGVTGAGMSHVLVSRIVNVTEEVRVTPGMVTGPAWGGGFGPTWGPGARPGWGPGWNGFHGYHSAFWGHSMVVSTPPRVTTTQRVHADSRVFDARDADVLWAATTTTTLGFDTVSQIVDQFVQLILTTLQRDGIV